MADAAGPPPAGFAARSPAPSPCSPIASWSGVAATETRRIRFCRERGWQQEWTRYGFIPHGAGHSWGDAAFLTHGVTLLSDQLRTIERVDETASTVTAEAGVTMGELHAFLEAGGFHFPIYGGTHAATLGGAAAADIHGKNHPHAGSFGNHVLSLDLLTASGASVRCSRDEEPLLFAATIGGMGLTGFITRLTLRVMHGNAPCVRVRTHSVASIAEMLDRLDDATSDCAIGDWLEPGRRGSRGLVTLAKAADAGAKRDPPRRPWALPLPRINMFQPLTIRVLDVLLQRLVAGRSATMHLRRFNHGAPHEWFRDWNKLFGRRGLIEYHCAVPRTGMAETWHRLSRLAADRSTRPSFAVLKRLGANGSPGLLSFPMDGYSLNFRLADGPAARMSLNEFGWAVARLGGRIYLAKDAVATPDQIEAAYPRLREWRSIVRHWDPDAVIRSDLSKRLRLKPW